MGNPSTVTPVLFMSQYKQWEIRQNEQTYQTSIALIGITVACEFSDGNRRSGRLANNEGECHSLLENTEPQTHDILRRYQCGESSGTLKSGSGEDSKESKREFHSD